MVVPTTVLTVVATTRLDGRPDDCRDSRRDNRVDGRRDDCPDGRPDDRLDGRPDDRPDES